MGLVDRFERKLEDTVGDAFAKGFRWINCAAGGGVPAPPRVDTGAQEIHGWMSLGAERLHHYPQCA